MKRFTSFSVLGLMVLFSATPVQSEIYRWTDANGVTHFGERQPEQTDAEKIEVRNVHADPQAVKELAELQKASESARE